MDISTEIAAIQAASQGSELRQPLVGALNKLNSGSLPAVTSSDAGKILKVGANGWELGSKSDYMPVPTATMQITENDTYDVTNYASAQVYVSGGGGSVLVSKTITQNGTYDPADDSADGYNEVVVNVSDGGGGTNLLDGTEEPSANLGLNGDIYLQRTPMNSDLPTACNLVGYLEGTGTQFFYTDYYPNANTSIELDVEIVKYQAPYGSYLFGSRESSGAMQRFEFEIARNREGQQSGSNEYYALTSGNKLVESNNTLYGNRIKLYVTRTTAAWYDQNNNQIGIMSVSNANISNVANPFALFTLYGYASNTCVKGKIYGLKIFESNTLVKWFFPCIDNNNEACLYDVINSEFLRNSGTGNFNTGGTPVSGEVIKAYSKVNSTWQNLIGTDINDINTGGALQ